MFLSKDNDHHEEEEDNEGNRNWFGILELRAKMVLDESSYDKKLV